MKVCNKVKEECGNNDTLVLVLRNSSGFREGRVTLMRGSLRVWEGW